MRPDLQTLNIRLDILTMTLTELVRLLPAQDAIRAAEAIGQRVTSRVTGAQISERADTAVAADLAPILAALRRH